MAGTTKVEVHRDQWTLVAQTISGLFQNVSGGDVLVWEQAADPTTSEENGLIYDHKKGDVFSATVGIWVRLAPQAGRVNKSFVMVVEY